MHDNTSLRIHLLILLSTFNLKLSLIFPNRDKAEAQSIQKYAHFHEKHAFLIFSANNSCASKQIMNQFPPPRHYATILHDINYNNKTATRAIQLGFLLIIEMYILYVSVHILVYERGTIFIFTKW